MQVRIVFYLLFYFILISCTSGPGQKKRPGEAAVAPPQSGEASGFSIQECGGYRKLTVTNPWQKSADNRFDYYLVKKGDKIPDELNGKEVFATPVKRVVCLSTTQIGFLDALGELSSVTGLSGGAYVTQPDIKKGLNENRIREVGYEQSFNYEMIVQLKPEVVFAFGVGAEISAQVNKLHDLGIPVVLVGEYLEPSPLGKAAWIRFFGAFYQKEALADSIFAKVKTNYETIRSGVSGVQQRPAVLSGLPFKDTWWMAGGRSNLAVLIEDAGGKFLWSENSSKEAFPVSLEEVFVRAAKADFWINCSNVNTLGELLAYDPRFATLPAVKKMQVYNNNLRSAPGGGNDYWESGVIHPDLILSDLVRILHPELPSDGVFHYYKKIR